MNKNKIIQYLNSKKNNEYNYLDILLEKYCNDELSQLLSKYKFTNVEIFPQISKNGNSIEMCLTYQNIVANISLTTDEIEYSIYQLYATANEVNKNTFNLKCNVEFTFEDLLNSILLLLDKVLHYYNFILKNHEAAHPVDKQRGDALPPFVDYIEFLNNNLT